MTPEAANEIGQRVAAKLAGVFCVEGTCGSDVLEEEATPGEVVEAIEIAIQHEIAPLDRETMAHAMRGVAAYWLDRSEEIEARAAALEATR